MGAAVVLLIGAFVVAVLISATASQGRSVPLASPTPTDLLASASSAAASPPSGPPSADLYVHVSGAVRTPGLVTLRPGARVVDAVAAAGGLADDADPAGVNLARLLHDGEQFRVPKLGEPPAPAPGVGGSGMADASGGAVNLNTATQAELETLPRIGPALAQRILDWRAANGRFDAATDLLEVTGIGQKVFDGLKDRVVV